MPLEKYTKREEKAVGLILIEDNQSQLRLGSRQGEILIPCRNYTGLDLFIPGEIELRRSER